ncbi:MAG TPA: hypothetical protein VIV40_18795 [Kofleriaceae bacterium]
MKPDPELLREIGVNSTNVETAWAGAGNDLERGLNTWTRGTIGRDRAIAVRAALMSCALVIEQYTPNKPGLPPREYIDGMLAGIRRWLDEPTKPNTEAVRSALNVERSAHAWQQDADVESFWILEAVDHASLAVWSGERASYIVPMDFATCAARSVSCVLHAMLDGGTSEADAVSAIVDAVSLAAS